MKLDIQQIKDLMETMAEAGIARVKLKMGEEEIELELEHKVPPGQPPQAVQLPVYQQPAPGMLAHSPTPEAPAAAAPAEEMSGTFVDAPMVGTFYRTPSPEADDFVKVGDVVDEDTVVAIVEAMKVMNEVKAGVKGVVKEVMVDNGHPVEFGTHLFRIG